jgi:hypothetical protein
MVKLQVMNPMTPTIFQQGLVYEMEWIILLVIYFPVCNFLVVILILSEYISIFTTVKVQL